MLSQKQWGLLDTVDGLWIGDTAGPFTFQREDVAGLVAEVQCHTLDWPLDRIRAAPYEAPDELRMRDEVPTVADPRVVLDWLEAGPTTVRLPKKLYWPESAP